MIKKAIILVNLGSPNSAQVSDVRRYLKQFLMDKHVIDLPFLLRALIVYGLILPKRPKTSARAYESIWTSEGSPLVVISQQVTKLLQQKTESPVVLAMRYGQLSIESTMTSLAKQYPDLQAITLLPMYPQFAQSTVQTVLEETQHVIKQNKLPLTITTIPPFYGHPHYIDSLVASAQAYLLQPYDHILFSYHGLPERHLKKADPTGQHCLAANNCCEIESPAHTTCYRAQCIKTTSAFIEKTNTPKEKYSIAFQSRLGKAKWLTPYTDQELVRLAKNGVKKLLVICPAFVTDCLETLEEIGIRGRNSFIQAGGDELQLIPCLNDHPMWIDALKKLITSK